MQLAQKKTKNHVPPKTNWLLPPSVNLTAIPRPCMSVCMYVFMYAYSYLLTLTPMTESEPAREQIRTYTIRWAWPYFGAK